MNSDLDKCVPLIRSELRFGSRSAARWDVARPIVTISRESGCGAHAVAEKLAAYLEAHPKNGWYPWKVFDSNLVAKVLLDHKLPRRFARFMSEDRASELADTVDELLGSHPSSFVLVRHTAETILKLAERGNAILIGRGANIITRNLEHALHVRLTASLEKRLEHFRRIRDVPKAAAMQMMRNEDRGRRRYLKQHFGADVEDPRLYHIVINTDMVSYENAARIIGDIVLNRVGLKNSPWAAESQSSQRNLPRTPQLAAEPYERKSSQ